eukprot:SAG11_NODE_15996_length_560_cov_0.845987_1_plen_49_part_00
MSCGGAEGGGAAAHRAAAKLEATQAEIDENKFSLEMPADSFFGGRRGP